MYFDYAATTPPDEEVLKTFEAVSRGFWGNPQSLHRPGVRAEALLVQARQQVLELLEASEDYRCVFTSGATESNNMALKGTVRQLQHRGRHIVTSAVEHPSVLEVCRVLEREGCELTVLPVNAAGAVESDVLEAALRPDTILVSLMHVNNEVGAINKIMELGRVVQAQGQALFHVDAAQSVGKLPVRLDGSPVDMLTFSAHKFFGLKGAGALIMRRNQELPPLLHGGGQEDGLRSGTADPARAAALAKALRLALESRMESALRVLGFKEKLVKAFGAIEGTSLNGVVEGASPFILNYSVEGVRPETLLQALSEEEICISTVSACSTNKRAESAVVLALTGSHARAGSSVRISMSSKTTAEEVETLCGRIGPLVEALRVNRMTLREDVQDEV